ncbi:MAG: hypothetical protein MUF56_07270 [Solirubrobacteraceae bacterium]|jgi:hypothetical protein|nr:hypothetical protein [Solirubrobacteraceae bacterium]
MTYDAQEARGELLDAVGEATDQLAIALGELGAAYDLLDEATADRLEEDLFRPVQLAYGRAKRTHAGFAERSELPLRPFAPVEGGAPSHGVAGLVERAMDAVTAADEELIALQDSLLPVEVGDEELRAGLADVRRLLGEVRSSAQRFLSVRGR